MILETPITRIEAKEIAISSFHINKISINRTTDRLEIGWSTKDSTGSLSKNGIFIGKSDEFIDIFLASFGLTEEILEQFVFNQINL